MDIGSEGHYPRVPLIFEAPTAAEVVHVVRVIDGDTVVVKGRVAGDEHIRLYGIDAPEKTQARGAEATQSLEAIVDEQSERKVLLRRYGIDGYGRTLGILTTVGDPSNDINLEMIRRGWAWASSNKHDKVKPPMQYGASQTEARFLRLGLWQDDDPQNPHDFRAERRARWASEKKNKTKKRKHNRRRRSNGNRSSSESE